MKGYLVVILIALAVCVSGHSVMRSPTPWNTAANGAKPCGGGTNPDVPVVTWEALSTENITWAILAGDGAGTVTGLLDPAGGTDFTVPIPGLNPGPDVASGVEVIPITVPKVVCTGPDNTCTFQVLSSSGFVSCATIAITIPAETGNSGTGTGSGSSGSSNGAGDTKGNPSGGSVTATVLLPSLAVLPAAALIVAGFAGKGPAASQRASSSIEQFFQLDETGSARPLYLSHIRVLVIAIFLAGLEFIWSASLISAASVTSASAMAIVSVLFVLASLVFGIVVAKKHGPANLFMAHAGLAAVAAILQIVTIFVVGLGISSASSDASIKPTLVLMAFVVVLNILLLPLVVRSIIMSMRLRKHIGASPLATNQYTEADYQYYDAQ